MATGKAYSGSVRKLVLGIDVGTTFSGISYWCVHIITLEHRSAVDGLKPLGPWSNPEYPASDKVSIFILYWFRRLNSMNLDSRHRSPLGGTRKFLRWCTTIDLGMLVQWVRRHNKKVSKSKLPRKAGKNRRGLSLAFSGDHPLTLFRKV
jgi:hypothetical protein